MSGPIVVELWNEDLNGDLDKVCQSEWHAASRAVQEARTASRMFGCLAFVIEGDEGTDEALYRVFHNGREVPLRDYNLPPKP